MNLKLFTLMTVAFGYTQYKTLNDVLANDNGKILENSMKFYEILWNSRKFYAILGNPRKFYEILDKFRKF